MMVNVSLYKRGHRGTHCYGDLHTHTGIYSIICESRRGQRSVHPTHLDRHTQITYALSGHDLNVATIFTALQFFDVGLSITL